MSGLLLSLTPAMLIALAHGAEKASPGANLRAAKTASLYPLAAVYCLSAAQNTSYQTAGSLGRVLGGAARLLASVYKCAGQVFGHIQGKLGVNPV